MKKNSKIILLFIMTLAMAICFTSCGQSDSGSSQKSEKVAVGISWCDDINADPLGEDLQAFVDAVKASGGKPVLLELVSNEKDANAQLDRCDVLVLTGGEDIDPALYGEEPNENLEDVNKERDTSDMLITQAAIDRDMPTLGICRGLQVLNVQGGGTLYQDIPTQFEGALTHRDPKQEDFVYHDITIEKDSLLAKAIGETKLNVNSWHHQGIKDLSKDYTCMATSKDGMVESIQRNDSTYIYGIQFHPEWDIVDNVYDMTPIFKALMNAAK